MGCQKDLDFDVPPGVGAHLSYYWTMDEAADLNKIDSAAAHSWTATTGNLSPAGLFSNGIQLDCTFVAGFPFYHGLTNFDDLGLAFDSTTATGLSFWFWIKQVVAPNVAPPATFVEMSLQCHDPGYAPNDCSILVSLTLGSANVPEPTSQIIHNNYTDSTSVNQLFTFAPVIGAWHMLAVTLDLVAHTFNIYQDGVLLASVADAIGFLTAPQGDLILKYSYGVVQPGIVVVDELGLSLKGALSAAQVTSLYNAGAGVTWPNITPVVPFP